MLASDQTPEYANIRKSWPRWGRLLVRAPELARFRRRALITAGLLDIPGVGVPLGPARRSLF
jgi:hypothetical protein